MSLLMNSPCVLYGTPLTTMDPDIYQICTNAPDLPASCLQTPAPNEGGTRQGCPLGFSCEKVGERF